MVQSVEFRQDAVRAAGADIPNALKLDRRFEPDFGHRCVVPVIGRGKLMDDLQAVQPVSDGPGPDFIRELALRCLLKRRVSLDGLHRFPQRRHRGHRLDPPDEGAGPASQVAGRLHQVALVLQ